MAAKYKIGRHEFHTREEYEDALKDLKRIKSIVNKIDIDNPKHVLSIYKLIHDGRISFVSKVGAAFCLDISDRIAQYTLEGKIDEKKSKKKKKRDLEKEKKSSAHFNIIGIVCIVLAIICFFIYGCFRYSEIKSNKELEQIQNQKDISQAISWYIERIRSKDAQSVEEDQQDIEADTGINTEMNMQSETETQTQINTEAAEEDREMAVDETVSTEPVVLQEYANLHARYPDMIGWLSVEDSKIELPVVQAADNEYYLKKNIDGKEDINGSLFMDCRDDILKPSTNLIIYGHNMRSGAMFGDLKKFLDTDFVKGHSIIEFDTIYEKGRYEVIAVCLSRVGYQDDDINQYYDFIEAESADDIQSFLEYIRKCAVYDKTQDVTESDKFLTLSTCNSYVEDGRLFVVAKKIQ